MTTHFAYVEFQITRRIFAITLDSEIARLTCTCISEPTLVDLHFVLSMKKIASGHGFSDRTFMIWASSFGIGAYHIYVVTL